ncbi:hypothetical protein [Archangium lansingense]|uniref:Protein kinase n=1 Tax=Archangium lansingense TaxID=2995310 RepID=A0ABT4AR40_9BACT|nr:hypothetical protein [Archangium lansinium]MCY1083629.1 hypothetical protein [Archangium lansinium]
MDEDKKPEAIEEEPERVGPYLIQEQVQQSNDSQEELYLAKHETSGATALVRKHTAEEGRAPGKDWRVVVGSSASQGYSVMEVMHTGWARAQERQSAESLLLTLEGLFDEARRMVRAMSDPHEPRLQWRLGLSGVIAATVCALLFSLVRPASVSPPMSAPPAPMSYEVPMEAETSDFNAWLADTTPPGQTVLAHPLPKEPLKGQKRPPCTRYVETELVGACWAEHAIKAPCPQTLFEYQGKCYLPSFSAKPPPSSLGQ